MALEDFNSKMVFSRGFGRYLWNFLVARSLGAKGQGLLQSLENFRKILVDFWSVKSG
jgi:hypothetical protein